MKTRLQILEASLEKKRAKWDAKFGEHFNDVRGAQGEPMGRGRARDRAALNRWERQDQALRTLNKEIEKTESAIEREKYRLVLVADRREKVSEMESTEPRAFGEYIREGKIKRWFRHPNRFFVVGVDRARLVWENNRLSAWYTLELKQAGDRAQVNLFYMVWNDLHNEIQQELLANK